MGAALDLTCKRYGMIPSKVMGLEEPSDILFDIILASKGYLRESEQYKEEESKVGSIGSKISAKRKNWDRSALEGWK